MCDIVSLNFLDCTLAEIRYYSILTNMLYHYRVYSQLLTLTVFNNLSNVLSTVLIIIVVFI